MAFVMAPAGDGDPEVARHLVEWVTTATWNDSLAFLTEHAEELLTESGEAALQQLIADNPNQQVLPLHLGILHGARQEGIEAAYLALNQSLRVRALAEGLMAWVSTPSWDEAQAFFEVHADDLMSDEAEYVLGLLAVDNPEQPDLLAHQGLLSLCRIDGSDKAYHLLSDPERLRRLVMSPAGQKDLDRALPRARLLAGLFPDDPEALFNLALAAVWVGDRAAAERAMTRCAAVIPAEHRPTFGRRLSDLADTEPDMAAVLYMLQGYLDQRSDD